MVWLEIAGLLALAACETKNAKAPAQTGGATGSGGQQAGGSGGGAGGSVGSGGTPGSGDATRTGGAANDGASGQAGNRTGGTGAGGKLICANLLASRGPETGEQLSRSLDKLGLVVLAKNLAVEGIGC